MIRAAIIGLVMLPAFTLLAGENKQIEMDKTLARIEKSERPADATAPMLYILANAQDAPALQLFLASAIAMSVERLEDAAFLFYAAQMRMRYDLVRFPASAQGGDGPGVALGAISYQLGAEINPAVMRTPASFSKVVERVKAWEPAALPGYNPGWEHGAQHEADAKRQLAEHRTAFVKQFGGLSTLLNDPEYFAAFKVVQDFNFAPYEEQQLANRATEKKAAEEKMLAIEKKRGIEGLYNRRSGT